MTIGTINVAEALISKGTYVIRMSSILNKTQGYIERLSFEYFIEGLAPALRHRQDDDQRSSHYDDLLSAETRAIKNGKGLHSKKEAPTHRMSDVSGKSFL